VIRSGALLGLGFFGVGAIADAIDVFEGLEELIHSIPTQLH
jgi:hypothetical protein